MIDFSLVLPIHNQEDIIESVYKEIRKALDKLNITYECILVENGSRDNTLKVLKQLAKKYKNTRVHVAPQGYGSAVITGLNNAKGKYVGYTVSDGQTDTAIFPKVWKEANKGEFEIVKVKRQNRENIVRTLTSFVFSGLVSVLFGIPYVDINGSPRIFLRNRLKDLDLQYKDSFIDAEFAVKAHRLGWKIKEFSMENLDRAGGKSTRSYKTYLEFFKNMWKFRTSNTLSEWKKKHNL